MLKRRLQAFCVRVEPPCVCSERFKNGLELFKRDLAALEIDPQAQESVFERAQVEIVGGGKGGDLSVIKVPKRIDLALPTTLCAASVGNIQGCSIEFG